MSSPYLVLTKEDIFINTTLMALLRKVFGYGTGFSISIQDVEYSQEGLSLKTKVTIIIREKPPIAPFTITKNAKHINPSKFVDRGTWTEVIEHVCWILEGRNYKDWRYSEKCELKFRVMDITEEKITLIKTRSFRKRRWGYEIIDRADRLREFLPLEIWKQPNDLVKHLPNNSRWWKEYIESLNRPLNSTEISLMPTTLLPFAMKHDFLIILKELMEVFLHQ